MITLSNVREWLKGFTAAEHYYIGKLDNKPDKAIGVYNYKYSGEPVTAIGEISTYDVKNISLLIHWTVNADETEQAAQAVYEQLRTLKNQIVGTSTIYMIELFYPEPVAVGTDEKNVYEYVIDFRIYYERIEK